MRKPLLSIVLLTTMIFSEALVFPAVAHGQLSLSPPQLPLSGPYIAGAHRAPLRFACHKL